MTGVALSALTAFTLANPPSGGTYVITKQVVAAGGERVSAGPYELTGTVGQAEAQGPVSGSGFVLTGGFHSPSAPVVPLPDSVFRDSFE